MPPTAPALTRTRSQQIADGAVEALKAQRDTFLEQGVSTLSFGMGMANVLLVAFVIGRWPMCYWIFHAVKGFVYYPIVAQRFYAKNQHWSLLEICWVSNGLTVVALLVGGVNELLSGALLSAGTLRTGFLVVFMFGAGPLGWSVAALGNSMVVHSVEHMASLFIHAGPFLTCWSLLDAGPARVAEWFPHIGAMLAALQDAPPSRLTELLAPAAAAYMLWWLPYTLLHVAFLHDGLLYVQSFEASAQRLFRVLARGSRPLAAMCYCLGHLLACAAAFAFATVLFDSPRMLFTIFCAAMLGAALVNGSSRYNYYLVDAYAKKLGKAIDESLSAKGTDGHDVKDMM